ARADVHAAAEDGETPLHLAAQDGQEQTIRLLVAAGARVDATSEDGETPLHVAVQHCGSKALGHIATLVELRADPSICDGEGRDALATARVMTNRAQEILDVLEPGGSHKASGAESSERSSKEMEKVLRVACQRGQVDIVKHLLETLRSHTVPDAAARSLVAAAAGGSVEVAEVLLAARAD
ncbi:unnamed protein product, partial [Polarella glacialis]